jgi:hypothetical protein
MFEHARQGGETIVFKQMAVSLPKLGKFLCALCSIVVHLDWSFERKWQDSFFAALLSPLQQGILQQRNIISRNTLLHNITQYNILQYNILQRSQYHYTFTPFLNYEVCVYGRGGDPNVCPVEVVS